MELRRIGDVKVGAIGLGGMPMSVREVNDIELGVRTVHRALDGGVTLVDTADVYTPDDAPLGHNEDLVAKALATYAGSTDDVLVATKGGMTRDGSEWGTDGRPEAIRASCEGSLRRLGVDSIGLYQHHRPDPAVPYAETIGALKDLLDAGLVQRAGLSNADPGQIELAHEILGDGLVSVQNQFSPRFRSSEAELELCDRMGIAFLPWSPLGGMSRAADLGSTYRSFAEVAERYGVSPQQMCLAWQLRKAPTVIPIPGASRPESIADSVRAVDIELAQDDFEILDAAA